MITKLTSLFNYEECVIGEVIGDTPIIREGESLKVRIPVYMPNIPNGKASSYSIDTNGIGIFKNDPSCRPKLTSSVIREQNFLTVKLFPGEDICDITQKENVKKNEEESLEYIPDGTRVSVGFSNGKLSKAYFKTNIYK